MKIQDSLIHLLLKQPFYGHIASIATPVESLETPTIKIITTPNIKLLYNRKWFEELNDRHAIGAVTHELLHLILLHPFRKEDRDARLWIIACDMAVNEHIDHSILPKDAITVENIAAEIREKIPKLRSAEYYYGIISKSDNLVSFFDNNEIKIVLKTGLELKANNSIESDSSEINKNAVKSVLSDLMQEAQSESEIPMEIDSFIGEVYVQHAINWRNVLKRFLTGRGKMQIRKTCKRESKRFENLPGNKRSLGTIALLALDESGSISERQLESFYNELMNIKKITGVNLSVTEFDTECSKPIPIEKYNRSIKRVKNGGTDFRPVFELADKLQMKQIVIFTDGEGTAPDNVNQKVLWALTKGGKKPVDYGHSITIET